MVRRRSPFWALFTLFALVVGTVAPDRAATRDRFAPIVASDVASTTAIPAVWNVSIHAAERPAAPRSSHALQFWLASRLTILGDSAPSAPFGRATTDIREHDPHAFTYDATAPPSIAAL